MGKKGTKEKHGLKETVGAQIVGNAIAMIIVMALAVLLTFVAQHTKYDGMSTVLGFIACTIPFFSIMQIFMPIHQTRADLLHGKWEFKNNEPSLASGPLINGWALIIPRALAYGVGLMLLVYFSLVLIGWQPGPTVTGIIAYIAVVITTTALIKRFLPRDIISFAAALKKPKLATPIPMSTYLLVEHALPFILLQGFINACIANKGYPMEALKRGMTDIPTEAMVGDFFFTALILALLQWLFSHTQVRGEVHLGRCDAKGLKGISGWAATGQIFAMALLVALFSAAVFLITGVHSFSLPVAILLKEVVVIFSVIFGAWIGIRFGGSREYALIHGTEATQPAETAAAEATT